MKFLLLTDLRAALLSILALSFLTGCAAPTAAADTPRSDHESIDAILGAVYEVISGPAGQERDWERFYTLFVPEARLIPTGLAPDGSFSLRALTPQEYVDTSSAFLVERGFFESEIHRVVEQFGAIAHVFSTYQAHNSLDDPEPFMRGINSFQLFHDGSRWWVVTIYWGGEREDLPIPRSYGGP